MSRPLSSDLLTDQALSTLRVAAAKAGRSEFGLRCSADDRVRGLKIGIDVGDHGADRRRDDPLQLAVGISAVGRRAVPFDLLDTRSNHAVEQQGRTSLSARWRTDQERLEVPHLGEQGRHSFYGDVLDIVAVEIRVEGEVRLIADPRGQVAGFRQCLGGQLTFVVTRPCGGEIANRSREGFRKLDGVE